MTVMDDGKKVEVVNLYELKTHEDVVQAFESRGFQKKSDASSSSALRGGPPPQPKSDFNHMDESKEEIQVPELDGPNPFMGAYVTMIFVLSVYVVLLCIRQAQKKTRRRGGGRGTGIILTQGSSL